MVEVGKGLAGDRQQRLRRCWRHPDATRVRVRLFRYRTLPPARVLAGETPRGRYEHTAVFEAEARR